MPAGTSFRFSVSNYYFSLQVTPFHIPYFMYLMAEVKFEDMEEVILRCQKYMVQIVVLLCKWNNEQQ